MSQAKRIYSITVAGQYMSVGDASGSKTLRKYEATFKLLSMEAALSVIVSKLLEIKLRKTYPDYVTYRTHKITKVEVEGPKPSAEVLGMVLEKMSLEQLADFCILREIQVDPYKCEGKEVMNGDQKTVLSALAVARQTVVDRWNDKRALMADQEVEKTARMEDDDLLSLNGLDREDAPVKMIFKSTPGEGEIVPAHTPGAKVVNRVVDAVEPADEPLPEPEPEPENAIE